MTDNLMSDTMLRAAIRNEARIDLKLKAARDEKKTLRKRIKAYGVDLKNYDAAKVAYLSEDNGDAYSEQLREQQRLLRLLEHDAGYQFTFLDAEKAKAEREAEAAETQTRNFRMGATAHLLGADETENPHGLQTEEGQDWSRGWRWSEEQCAEGEKDMDAADQGVDRDDAAEDTKPADPKKSTNKKKATVKKASVKRVADVEDSAGASVH